MCICEILKILKYSQENVSRFLHFCDRISKFRKWLSILIVFCVFENVEDIEDDFEYTEILYDDVEFSKFLIDQKICDTCSSFDVFWIWLILRSHFRFSWFSTNFLANFLSIANELLIKIILFFFDRYYQISKTSISTFSMIKTRTIEIVFIRKIFESNNWRRNFQQFLHSRFVRFYYRFQRIRNRTQSFDSRKIRIDRWFTICSSRLKQIQCESIEDREYNRRNDHATKTLKRRSILFFWRFWKNRKNFCSKHCHDQIANNRIAKWVDYRFRDDFVKHCDHVFRKWFHYSFSIQDFLNTTNENMCNIKKNIDRCEFIKKIKLIFWNEIFYATKMRFRDRQQNFFRFLRRWRKNVIWRKDCMFLRKFQTMFFCCCQQISKHRDQHEFSKIFLLT